MRSRWILVCTGLALMLVRATGAHGACTLNIPNLTFPVLTSAGQSADSKVTMHLECNPIHSASKLHLCVSFSQPRVLTGPQPAGQHQLEYRFYSDEARTQLWGCRGCSVEAPELQFDIAGPPNKVVADIPLYGRVTAGQTTLPNGDYSSTVAPSQSEIYRIANYSSTSIPCASLINALDSTQQFTVSAKLAPECLVTAASIDFGSQTLKTEVRKYGEVRVKCPPATAYTIALGPGGSGSVTNRLLNSSRNDTLQYALRDPTCNTIWGDGGSGSTTVSGTGNGADVPHAVCAVLPAQALKPPGIYSDTIVVTVTY